MNFKSTVELDAWSNTVEKRLGEAWAKSYGTESNERALHELGTFLKFQAANGIDPRRRAKMEGTLDRVAAEKAFKTITKADLGTPLYSDATTGSYLVPVDYLAEIQRIADLESVFLGRARKVGMNSNTMSVPKEDTTLSLAWNVAQSSQKTEVNPTFGTDTLTSYTLAGWIACTDEMLEDSAVALGTYFSEVWGQKYGRAIDNAILNGTGTPCTGVFQGLSGIETVTMNAGDTSDDDISADYLVSMMQKLSGAERKGAIWVMNPVIADQVRALKDANGRFIWADMAQGNPASIFGYPVHLCDDAPASATEEESFVLFGAPKHIMLGVRKDLEIKFYPDTAYAVEYDEVFWRARARLAVGFPIPSALVVLKTAAS